MKWRRGLVRLGISKKKRVDGLVHMKCDVARFLIQKSALSLQASIATSCPACRYTSLSFLILSMAAWFYLNEVCLISASAHLSLTNKKLTHQSNRTFFPRISCTFSLVFLNIIITVAITSPAQAHNVVVISNEGIPLHPFNKLNFIITLIFIELFDYCL